jgi:uncharacterized protein (DUF1501 family)
MKRRNFLKIAAPATLTPFVVNGHSLRPFANSKMANILNTCEGVEDRALILIQLKGGNDGMNTIIPINQYDAYANLRPNIKVADTGTKKYINLDTTLKNSRQVGLHPVMTKVKEMYDQGMVSVIQGVGYELPNQSHFKATDLWLTGGDGSTDNYNIQSGWMGRALQAIYPEVLGAPTSTMLDPLGIQIGDSSPSLGFHTETEHQNSLNLSGQDPAGFYSLIQTIGGAPIQNVPDSEHGEELKFIMGVEQSINLYAQRITQVFNAGTNALTYPANNNLAAQLKTVARMIRGGCKTKIYLCQLGGFDTHNAQVLAQDATTGDHADNMLILSDAVKAFFDDLTAMGIGDKAMACTFSEFGRCAKENGSDGTDHGTLSPMLVFGAAAQAGVLGENVNLSNLTADNQLQGTQHDYRQVFATLLQDWLGCNQYVMEQAMFDGYSKLPLIGSDMIVDPGCYIGAGPTIIDGGFTRPSNASLYPNPSNIGTELMIESQFDYDARITLHSLGGSVVYSKSARIVSGTNQLFIETSTYPPGNYFIRVENKISGAAEVMKLVVAR